MMIKAVYVAALSLALAFFGCTSLEGIREKGSLSTSPRNARSCHPSVQFTLRDAYSFRFTKEVANWSRELTRNLTITLLHPTRSAGSVAVSSSGKNSRNPASAAGVRTSNTWAGALA